MLNVQKRLVTGALAAMVFGVCAGANAAEILVFNFTDQDAVADVVAAGLTSTDFTNGGGLTHVSFQQRCGGLSRLQSRRRCRSRPRPTAPSGPSRCLPSPAMRSM